MKVDNDVLTDSEQLDDAYGMMKENLKETIEHIKKDPNFLSKNVSKEIRFRKFSKRKL
jgi:hypothetical protein